MTRDLERQIQGAMRVGASFPLTASALSSDPEPTSWHMLAVEGHWDGHWQGPFSLDAQMFDQMVQARRAAKVDAPVYYGHADFFGGESAAAGWLQTLETRQASDGSQPLWGQFKWNAKAAAAIRADEFRYLSPSIVWNSIDRKSGKMGGAAIVSVALTNRPFLEELPQVRLNANLMELLGAQTSIVEDPMNPEQYRALCALLGLTATATADDVMNAVRGRQSAALMLSSTLTELGLQPNASQQDITAKLLALKQPGVSLAEFEQLKAQIADRNAQDAVAKALSERKLTAVGTPMHTWALEAARKSPEFFASWAQNAPAVIPELRHQATERRPAGSADFSDEEIRQATKLGMTVEDMRLRDAQAKALEEGMPLDQVRKMKAGGAQ